MKVKEKEKRKNKITYVVCTNCAYILVGSIICVYGTILSTINLLEYLMTCWKDLQTQNYIKQVSHNFNPNIATS